MIFQDTHPDKENFKFWLDILLSRNNRDGLWNILHSYTGTKTYGEDNRYSYWGMLVSREPNFSMAAINRVIRMIHCVTNDHSVDWILPSTRSGFEFNPIYQKLNKDVSSTDVLNLLEMFRSSGLKASSMFILQLPQSKARGYPHV